jgi:hypothetical protein
MTRYSRKLVQTLGQFVILRHVLKYISKFLYEMCNFFDKKSIK